MLQIAFDDFHKECDAGDDLDTDAGLAARYNALIRLQINSRAAAHVAVGVGDASARRKARREVKRQLVANWPVREVSISESRAMAASLAYVEGIRFFLSRKNDSRMAAALQTAALIEGLVSDDAVETVRKSITRLRKRMRGENMFRLNPDLLEIEVVSAESVMFSGLPGRRGRPRTPK